LWNCELDNSCFLRRILYINDHVIEDIKAMNLGRFENVLH